MNSPTHSDDDPLKVRTPRYWYHCLDHPATLLRSDDRHFREGHAAEDLDRLRVRCYGQYCTHCVPVPDSQEDEALGANPDQLGLGHALAALAPTGQANPDPARPASTTPGQEGRGQARSASSPGGQADLSPTRPKVLAPTGQVGLGQARSVLAGSGQGGRLSTGSLTDEEDFQEESASSSGLEDTSQLSQPP